MNECRYDYIIDAVRALPGYSISCSTVVDTKQYLDRADKCISKLRIIEQGFKRKRINPCKPDSTQNAITELKNICAEYFPHVEKAESFITKNNHAISQIKEMNASITKIEKVLLAGSAVAKLLALMDIKKNSCEI